VDLKTTEEESGSMWALEGYVENLVEAFKLITEQVIKLNESGIVYPNQSRK
jgi:hypothetical protein